MKKLIRWLDVNFEAVLMVVFFAMMIILVTVQVIFDLFLKPGSHGARRLPGFCLYGCLFQLWISDQKQPPCKSGISGGKNKRVCSEKNS